MNAVGQCSVVGCDHYGCDKDELAMLRGRKKALDDAVIKLDTAAVPGHRDDERVQNKLFNHLRVIGNLQARNDLDQEQKDLLQARAKPYGRFIYRQLGNYALAPTHERNMPELVVDSFKAASFVYDENDSWHRLAKSTLPVQHVVRKHQTMFKTLRKELNVRAFMDRAFDPVELQRIEDSSQLVDLRLLRGRADRQIHDFAECRQPREDGPVLSGYAVQRLTARRDANKKC